VAEAAGAADELAEDDVAERVAAPPLRVAPRHSLRLLPALLLHRVREAPGLRRRRRRRREQQLVQVGGHRGGGGGRTWGGRASRGAEGLRRRRRRLPISSAAAHRLSPHHRCLVDEPLCGAMQPFRVLQLGDFFRDGQMGPDRIR